VTSKLLCGDKVLKFSFLFGKNQEGVETERTLRFEEEDETYFDSFSF
jgi:hypothetical protein